MNELSKLDKEQLKTLIIKYEAKLDDLNSIEDCVEFCQNFSAESMLPLPISIKNLPGAHEIELSKLNKKNFPEDFITYYNKYHNIEIVLRHISLNFEFLNHYWDDRSADLYEMNGFNLMVPDGGGNFYLYDSQTGQILLSDHNEIFSGFLDLEELYEEIYNVYNEDGAWIIPGDIKPEEVLDSNQQLDAKGKYVKKHFYENLKVTEFKTFNDLFVKLIKDALVTFKERTLKD